MTLKNDGTSFFFVNGIKNRKMKIKDNNFQRWTIYFKGIVSFFFQNAGVIQWNV